MNIIFEMLSLIVQTIFSLVPNLFVAMKTVYDAISGIQDQLIAACFGIPVIAVSIGSFLLTIIGFVAKIFFNNI